MRRNYYDELLDTGKLILQYNYGDYNYFIPLDNVQQKGIFGNAGSDSNGAVRARATQLKTNHDF